MIFPPTTSQESWIPGYSGICENEIANELTREGTVHQFVGPEPALGVSKQNIKKKITCWLSNQNVTMWQGLTCTQRQAQELISDPRLAAKTRLLSFNKMQSCTVIGLLTGITPWQDNATWGWFTVPCVRGVKQRGKPQLLFCGSAKLWQHTYLPGVLFLGHRKC